VPYDELFIIFRFRDLFLSFKRINVQNFKVWTKIVHCLPNYLENSYITPSLALPHQGEGRYDWHFHCSCLHAEERFACLRGAASAKAGHAGVGDEPVMKDCLKNYFQKYQYSFIILNKRNHWRYKK